MYCFQVRAGRRSPRGGVSLSHQRSVDSRVSVREPQHPRRPSHVHRDWQAYAAWRLDLLSSLQVSRALQRVREVHRERDQQQRGLWRCRGWWRGPCRSCRRVNSHYDSNLIIINSVFSIDNSFYKSDCAWIYYFNFPWIYLRYYIILRWL